MPLMAIVDKTEHTRRRKFWIRGFTITALKGYEGFVKKRSLQLIDTLASKNLSKETQNLTEWFAFYSYDLMMDLACVILSMNNNNILMRNLTSVFSFSTALVGVLR
jgi:cytochrome P450